MIPYFTIPSIHLFGPVSIHLYGVLMVLGIFLAYRVILNYGFTDSELFITIGNTCFDENGKPKYRAK